MPDFERVGPSLTRRQVAKLAAAAAAASALGGAAGPWAGPAVAATAEYDDGSAAVPPGGAVDPERVIVIGAGWAGLAAANALRNAGVECVVVEARRRIGGRAWTVAVDGGHFDLGCSWIHEPIGNPLTAFAEQAGVARTSGDIELDAASIRFYDAVAGRDLAPSEAALAFARTIAFEEEAAERADELGPAASIADGARAYLDEAGVTGPGRRHAEYLIRLFAELGDNLDWGRVSLDYWGKFESPYSGIGQGDFPVGGYGRLIDAIGAGTDVRLGHRATRIERSNRGVVVTTEARTRRGPRRVRFRGSHVLVTLPLGVLKHEHEALFSPRLPADKRAAISRMGFGRFQKVAMLFDEPFWEQGARTHILHISREDRLASPLFIDMQRTHGFPALVCTSAGVYGRELEALPDAEVLARTLTVLRETLGGPIPEPREVLITRWGRDRFARGAYSTVLAPHALDDVDLIGAATGQRLLFAGEATSRRNGYADGAFSSGIREAKRLLQQPAVRLSA